MDREECECDDWLIGDVAVMLTLRPLSVTVTEPVGAAPCEMSSANVGGGTGVVLVLLLLIAAASPPCC